MRVTGLPSELIEKIAEHVAQQSGLDLLAFSRTCSSLRSAARRAGRADLREHAQALNPGNDESKYTTPVRSRLLGTCVRELPDLDFPIQWESLPGVTPPEQDALLLRNFASESFEWPHTRYEFSSSLFLSQVDGKVATLWDLLDFPPRRVELSFQRDIPRANCWTDELFSRELSGEHDSYPCFLLQAISIGNIRAVLAQTFFERTLHLMDSEGQPYLAYNLSLLTEQSTTSPPPRRDDTRPRKGRALAKDGPGALETDGGGRSFIRGATILDTDRFLGFWDYKWRAARLPPRRKGAADPGVLLYHLPLHAKHVEWMLLLARPDCNSTETITSGKIDLSWLTGSSRLPKKHFRTKEFELRVHAPENDDSPYIVEARWQEWSARAVSKNHYSSDKLRLVHFSLGDISSLASRDQSARSRVASILVPTTLSEMASLRPKDFRLSSDGLRLFVFSPSTSLSASSVLRVHVRSSCEEAWRARAQEYKFKAGYRVLGSFGDWFVLADGPNSIKALNTSSARCKVHTFDMRFQHDDYDYFDAYDMPHLSLVAGRVMLMFEKGPIGSIVDLLADGGPLLIEPDQLVAKCIAMHSTTADGSSTSRKTGTAEDSLDDSSEVQYRIFCHGPADPNAKDFKVCLDHFDRKSRADPLVLFICDLDQAVYGPGRLEGEPPQYIALLHPCGKIESIRHAPVTYDCFQLSDVPFFTTATRRQLLLDYSDSMETEASLLLADFDAGQAYAVEFSEATAVLGRWTNDLNASYLLFRSPNPVDPEQPLRCWYFAVADDARHLEALSNDLESKEARTSDDHNSEDREDAEGDAASIAHPDGQEDSDEDEDDWEDEEDSDQDGDLDDFDDYGYDDDDDDDDDEYWEDDDDSIADSHSRGAARYAKGAYGATGGPKVDLVMEVFEALASEAPDPPFADEDEYLDDDLLKRDELTKRRLLPNWVMDEDGALYIGGVHRLLAFLTGAEPSAN